MNKAFVLRKWATEQGLHQSDVLIEFGQATLASGTVEIKTGFASSQIIGFLATRVDSAAVAANGSGALALTTDLVVTSGAITVSTTVNTYTGVIFYAIFARTQV